MKSQININQLSEHLFWDVDITRLHDNVHKKLIIQRVLEYGLFTDWQIIYKYYGIDEIAKIAASIRDLDLKSATFLSTLSGVPLEEFVCYTMKQSIPRHWNF